MPRDLFGRDFHFLERDQILTFEEVARMVRIFVGHGVSKVRLTGGEPLLRRDLEQLIGMLVSIDGLHDLTLTTNGALLAAKATRLKQAGLMRVTVSLDSLDDVVFRAMNDVNFPLIRVLKGIEAADAAGLRPIKLNAVIRRGINEEGIVDLAQFARERGYIMRFIEYMDVGNSNGWRMDDVVPAAEIVERISRVLPLEPIDAQYRGEVAQRHRYRDGSGEVGVIASVTQPFCRDCTRARLSAEGELYTCLFATKGHDLRSLIRSGATDDQIDEFIGRIWRRRGDRYSELRSTLSATPSKVEMYHIGG